MSDRDFKGVWIPADIWLHEDLALLDKVMLIEIDSLDGADGCWKSNESFAEFFGVGSATIKRSVKKLTELSFINRTMRKHETGSRRVIKMIRPLSSMIRPPGSKRSDPSDQNDPQGNTVEGIVSKDTRGGSQKRPTLEEVTAYCKERGKGIDPQNFIDHYTSNGWKVGKNPMKDWKACVRTWEKNRKTHRSTLSTGGYSDIQPGEEF